jgi:predicted nuclease of restriction endonuclease-like (RecB) superfamily
MMRLTRRERSLAVGLIVLVICWVLFVFGIRPAAERIETLNRVIPEKQKELEELRTKSTQYLTLQAGLDDYKRKAASEEKGFELLSFLESINDQLHLAEKVVAMKQQVIQLDSSYCEIIVETEMENLTLKQLMDFLLKIKSSNHLLQIKSLYTKKNTANTNLLDSVIQVSTLKLNNAT